MKYGNDSGFFLKNSIPTFWPTISQFPYVVIKVCLWNFAFIITQEVIYNVSINWANQYTRYVG